jgi:hypothetical protein
MPLSGSETPPFGAAYTLARSSQFSSNPVDGEGSERNIPTRVSFRALRSLPADVGVSPFTSSSCKSVPKRQPECFFYIRSIRAGR